MLPAQIRGTKLVHTRMGAVARQPLCAKLTSVCERKHSPQSKVDELHNTYCNGVDEEQQSQEQHSEGVNVCVDAQEGG